MLNYLFIIFNLYKQVFKGKYFLYSMVKSQTKEISLTLTEGVLN
jgi:hypothetical protein